MTKLFPMTRRQLLVGGSVIPLAGTLFSSPMYAAIQEAPKESLPTEPKNDLDSFLLGEGELSETMAIIASGEHGKTRGKNNSSSKRSSKSSADIVSEEGKTKISGNFGFLETGCL